MRHKRGNVLMRDPDTPKNPPEADREYDCNDPTHGVECDCGATPDMDYDRHNDI